MSKHVLMIIAPDQFRDEELLVPRGLFIDQGWNVTTISTQTGDAKGMLGAIEPITNTVDTIDPKQYDAAIVVGGMGSIEYLWDNTTVHAIVKQLYDGGKTIGAICLSGAVLAKAGILNDKKATVWPDETAIQVLKESGATYTGTDVVVDNRVITANGPEAAKAFGEALIQSIQAVLVA